MRTVRQPPPPPSEGTTEEMLNAAGQPFRVLIVEDDVELARLTSEYLQKRGLLIEVEHNGARALKRIENERPQLIVLDVMLPGMDGFEICRQLRARGADVPVIMLTARDEDIDQVLGLEIGADDYLAKPVQPRVLLAHIKAILRRSITRTEQTGNTDSLQFGQLHISKASRDVRIGDEAIELTTAEFDLLWLMATNAGRVLPRNEILKALRGLDYDGVDRSIDSRISRLRRKLGDGAVAAAHIKTVRPHGYLFSPTAW